MVGVIVGVDFAQGYIINAESAHPVKPPRARSDKNVWVV